ncbi:unnamed protein product [Auanema sp. JU1783]|nr:unnamed protein product [Auanema sp. JU1783]
MAGRRQSVTAQLQRQARRFSTAIAPQFTRIEPVTILQKSEYLILKITDTGQITHAVQQYVMKNAVMFDPVEFELFDQDGFRIMTASLFPDELLLQEGNKKLFSISFGEIDEMDSACIAKVKHPITGITVYELRELGGSVLIQANTDSLAGTRILTQSVSLASVLMACGCTFSKEQWSLVKHDKVMVRITPQQSFFSENSIKVAWNPNCDNELRVIALAFGLAQMVREAFPSLLHIVKEFRQRRS